MRASTLPAVVIAPSTRWIAPAAPPMSVTFAPVTAVRLLPPLATLVALLTMMLPRASKPALMPSCAIVCSRLPRRASGDWPSVNSTARTVVLGPAEPASVASLLNSNTKVWVPTVTEKPMPSEMASVLSKAICRAPWVTVNPARLRPPAPDRMSDPMTEVVVH